MGGATAIIQGVSVGMLSTGVTVIIISIGILSAFLFSGGSESIVNGIYGIAFAAIGMLSTLGITLATDAFGPIADNAGGNAEMAGLDPIVESEQMLLIHLEIRPLQQEGIRNWISRINSISTHRSLY